MKYKKYNAKFKNANITVMNLLAGLAALILGVAAIFALASMHSYAQPYGALSAASIVALFFLTVALIIRQRKAPSLLLGRTLSVVTFLVLGIAALLVIGLVQDVLGVYCAGIMGAQSTCAESWWLWIQLTIFSPYLLLPGALVMAAIVLYSQKSTKAPK